MPDNSDSRAVRVRFAPSPTGFLHVGGARTALFNWLFARHHGGVFVLRIEDTDLTRSTEESVQTILDGLAWLEITWDEGPFFQSREVEAHRAVAKRLVAEGKAYPCFCSPEDLDRKRQAAGADGAAWKYDRTCLRLDSAEVMDRMTVGVPAAIRFKVPEGTIAWDDLVHGPTTFDSAVIEDIVLLRSDGSPTYNLSCVHDDIGMRITHVIRGDDHISNTPKQILLYRAVGVEPPRFGHLPLILGPDKKRLSKRHGAVSVTEYRDRGILPETLFNFLALLGWSPGDGREKMTCAEMTAAFTLEAINRKGAVFDEQKLEWLNSQYINDLDPARLADLVRDGLKAAGLWNADLDTPGGRRDWYLRVLGTLKARSKVIGDFARDLRPFLSDEFDYAPDAVEKHLAGAKGGGSAAARRMRDLRGVLAQVPEFSEPATEEALRHLAESKGEAAATYIHPLRVALVGRAVSPGIFAILTLIGRDRAIARLDRLAGFLEAMPAVRG